MDSSEVGLPPGFVLDTPKKGQASPPPGFQAQPENVQPWVKPEPGLGTGFAQTGQLNADEAGKLLVTLLPAAGGLTVAGTAAEAAPAFTQAIEAGGAMARRLGPLALKGGKALATGALGAAGFGGALKFFGGGKH